MTVTSAIRPTNQREGRSRAAKGDRRDDTRDIRLDVRHADGVAEAREPGSGHLHERLSGGLELTDSVVSCFATEKRNFLRCTRIASA